MQEREYEQLSMVHFKGDAKIEWQMYWLAYPKSGKKCAWDFNEFNQLRKFTSYRGRASTWILLRVATVAQYV